MPGVMPLKVSCVRVRLKMSAKTLLLALVLCLTVTAVAKQSPSSGNGKLSGMVSDPLGVEVPSARIFIKGKRLKRELWPGDDGTYSVDLPPGTYNVRVTHPGFVPVRKRVRVARDVVTKLDVRFHIDPKKFVTVY
jgi:hypothetical protein